METTRWCNDTELQTAKGWFIPLDLKAKGRETGRLPARH